LNLNLKSDIDDKNGINSVNDDRGMIKGRSYLNESMLNNHTNNTPYNFVESSRMKSSDGDSSEIITNPLL